MSTKPTPDLGHVTARLHESFLLHSGSELEISYDGSRPPEDLFTGLVAIGWQHLSPSPPPASAIDWSTPDRAAGTRHTVLPYLATTTARLDGSARFLEVALEQTRALLGRHGLLDPAGPAHTGDPSHPTAVAGPASLGTIHLTVDAATADRVRMAAERIGTVLDDRGDVFVTETVYRGQRDAVERMVRCLTIELPVSQQDQFIAGLTGLGVRRIA